MSKFLKISIDLIEELENLTICDVDFDWLEWSRWDVDRLRRIADFIERELLINEKKEIEREILINEKKESHEPTT